VVFSLYTIYFVEIMSNDTQKTLVSSCQRIVVLRATVLVPYHSTVILHEMF